MSVDIHGEFADYWESRSKNLRRSIRGVFNKLREHNLAPRLVMLSRHDDIGRAIEQHGALEASSWKGRIGNPLSTSTSQGQFYVQMLQAFTATSQARVYQLYLGERLAASQLAVMDGATLALLKTGYADDLSGFSPGRLLDYLMLESLFSAKDVLRVEYCTNANAEDVRWATMERVVSQINLYRNIFVRIAVELLRRIRRLVRLVARDRVGLA